MVNAAMQLKLSTVIVGTLTYLRQKFFFRYSVYLGHTVQSKMA